jgi:hypothetical protein
MERCYCPARAFESAVDAALESCGLEADHTAANRRPRPADTFAAQSRRLELGGKVLALVRRSVPVGEDDRRLIYRLVDAACARLEEAEREPAEPAIYSRATARAVNLYAAKGGGCLGSFERFVQTYPTDAPLLEPIPEGLPEPVVDPVVDRQDVPPMPATTNPRPRTTPPGTAAPAKTNPTRAIRSSRSYSSRKGARR